MLQRVGDINLVDSCRSVLYLTIWNEACEEALAELTVVNGTPDSHSNWRCLIPLAQSWADFLDNIVVTAIAKDMEENIRKPGSTTERYTSFFFDTTGFTKVIQEHRDRYPFMYTLMERYMRAEIQALKLCLSRFRTDFANVDADEIKRVFGRLTDTTVTFIEPTASDGHCGRQKVLVLHVNGKKIVYKPFGAHCSQLFSHYVDQLTALKNTPYHLKSMSVYRPKDAKEDYCYAEFIENLIVPIAKVPDYYKKCGALLAILESLHFSDGHEENLIANAEFPVLIDCETFFQRVPNTFTSSDVILNTLLVQRKPEAFRVFSAQWKAAFQHPGVIEQPSSRVMISNERSCYLSVSYDEISSPKPSSSLPRSEDGTVHHLKDYTTEFLDGYQYAWEAINATQIANEMQKKMVNAPVRVILRPTAYYFTLMKHLLQPKVYSSESDARKLFEEMLLVNTEDQEQHELMVESEINQLLHFDIPSFYSTAMENSVRTGDGRLIPDVMNEEDTKAWKFGTSTTRTSCEIRDSAEFLKSLIGEDPEEAFEISDDSPLDFCFFTAKQIMNSFQTYFVKLTEQKDIIPMYSLYDGFCGVAIFFGAMYSYTKASQFKDVAIYFATSLDKVLREQHEENRKKVSLGLVGLGGFLYTFCVLAELLDMPSWFDVAYEVLLMFDTSAMIDNDLKYDFIDGSAGLLASLVTLYEKSTQVKISPQKRERTMEIMEYCANHLVNHATLQAQGHVSWSRSIQLEATSDVKQIYDGLTGFSHGNSGISFALRRFLSTIPGEDGRYSNTADYADAYEDNYYSKEFNNWKDIRSDVGNYEAASYCYGSPGIIGGRLEYGKLDSETLHHILPSLEAMPLVRDKQDISVCCGVTGVCSVLFDIGRREDFKHLVSVSKSNLKEVLLAIHKQILGTVEFDFGLFTGYTGIAYTCLNVYHDGKFPNVLMMK